MTEDDREQIRKAIRNSPKSIWGYAFFIAPVIVVIIGVVLQFILLAYFEKSRGVDLEVCIRHGKRVEQLWDNDLVKEAVLVVSGSITVTFGLLAFLAYQDFRQIKLLTKAAKELGIVNGADTTSQNTPVKEA